MNPAKRNPGTMGAAGASDDLLGGSASENTNPSHAQQGRDGRRTTPPGPFSACAAALTALGLAVIPVGGTDGKKPLVKWRNRRKLLSTAAIEVLCRNFSAANIGVITGLSDVTVVDCDARDAVAAMIERCGDTPLKTSTPSGGVHLWYRSNGERCANLRSQGLAVDVKADGGFVVVPPSVRPNGPYAGRAYQFLSGSWADLRDLPSVRPGSLEFGHQGRASQPLRLRAVKEGHRSDTLFRALLRHAPYCDGADDLRDVADTINDDFGPPLPPSEVQKTVWSAWNYQQTGKNWVGRVARAHITDHEHQILAAHRFGADALLLITKLRLSHPFRPEFFIAPKAMAHSMVFLGWGPRRYRHAAAVLVELGMLRITHRGGRGGPGGGDVRRYTFGELLTAAAQEEE